MKEYVFFSEKSHQRIGYEIKAMKEIYDLEMLENLKKFLSNSDLQNDDIVQVEFKIYREKVENDV